MDYLEKNNLGILSIPVKEKGIEAVVVFDKENTLDANQSDDILWLLNHYKDTKEKLNLLMPQCDFKYTFTVVNGDSEEKHAGALKLNRYGAEVGAASGGMRCDGESQPPRRVCIQSSFIFGFIKDKSLVGVAYIHQPWVH